MRDCEYCKDRDRKMMDYAKEIEREKIRECQKALEREQMFRIKSMQQAREEEIRLREMQKLQIEEKRQIEEEQQQVENLWHRVLVENVRRKEQKEREDYHRQQQDMRERRRTYDEQIASANRKRQEAVSLERERESRRIEMMRKKMDLEHYEAIKRKKEQQQTNKANFIEGHKEKMDRIRSEKRKEREMDNETIRVALEEMRRERQRDRDEMHRLQKEKQIFTEHHARERKMAAALEEETDRLVLECKGRADSAADQGHRSRESEERRSKEKAAKEYKKHIEQRNQELDRERQDRALRMQQVRQTAVRELQRRLDSANHELKRQIEYRQSLTGQIMDNQRVLETELKEVETKQRPFTRRADKFRDVMERIDKSPGRDSTNPVHPFRRALEKHQANPVQLPLIGNSFYNRF